MKIQSYKFLLVVVWILVGSAFAKAQLSTINTATRELFANHVAAGQVDYAAIKKDPTNLNTAIQSIKKINLNSLTAAERKALLINAYNLFTIKGVVDAYPIKSVMDDASFFDATRYELGGEMVSLNQLEKQILFKEFPDPRLHFVLVCGAVSCPPLNNKPFTAENTEFMLKKLTRAAINNPALVKIDMHEKVAYVSKIFDWYAADFTKKGTLIDYLNTYREDMIPDGFSVKFMSYNWSLNDAK
ncbi:DUF547 domain-containing protein [Nonlabens ponticola]|uniref:DUF547 domain-containing protein n=1 Tax=Nonlabens ponticola TaxID=2496866 RepID=A0A3S9MUF9_9FLAO|nr:DUF547 domain-containing protein [Nonlabens ponticola]AZQ42814.1 DUF547 domain-containing protein [Nonlabens ponticola]